MPGFSHRLHHAIQRTRTPLVVGLDPRLDSLPPMYADLVNGEIWDQAQAYRDFCCWIIDVVADLVPAVKPQFAFFEELGPAGTQALADVIRYARERNLIVIGDGKRGDIGSTAAAYASAYLGADSVWGTDALTVNPYLGGDTLLPFVDTARERQAGIFVLVKTSNPGSGDFQDCRLTAADSSISNPPLAPSAETLYQRVARELDRLSRQASADRDPVGLSEIGAVVGATYPEQLVDLRHRLPQCWLLIPGFGAQGGTAADTAGGFHSHGYGAIVNSSRAILYAFDRQERSHGWVDAVRQATLQANEQLRSATPAGNL